MWLACKLSGNVVVLQRIAGRGKEGVIGKRIMRFKR